MDRNLDGVYFRVEREGKWQSICFTDLHEYEILEVLQGRSESWLTNLYDRLVETLLDTKRIINREIIDQAVDSALNLLDKQEMSALKLIHIKNVIRNLADFYDIVYDYEDE